MENTTMNSVPTATALQPERLLNGAVKAATKLASVVTAAAEDTFVPPPRSLAESLADYKIPIVVLALLAVIGAAFADYMYGKEARDKEYAAKSAKLRGDASRSRYRTSGKCRRINWYETGYDYNSNRHNNAYEACEACGVVCCSACSAGRRETERYVLVAGDTPFARATTATTATADAEYLANNHDNSLGVSSFNAHIFAGIPRFQFPIRDSNCDLSTSKQCNVPMARFYWNMKINDALYCIFIS